jgi:DNA-binding transcriptional ArsR family regulator
VALADPSRRAVLAALAAGGPATATDLAARLPITRQAIAKHIALLADAGLVIAEPGERRRVRYRLRSAPMQVAQQFLAALARDWDGPLAACRNTSTDDRRTAMQTTHRSSRAGVGGGPRRAAGPGEGAHPRPGRARRPAPPDALAGGDPALRFDGPQGRVSLPELFAGRRQLIVYRAFFEPDVHGWPEHACIGCSLVIDHMAPVAHLNARDTTLVAVLAGAAGRHRPAEGADGLDAALVHADRRVRRRLRRGPVARHQRLHPRRRPGVPHLLRRRPGDEALGSTFAYLDITALGRQEEWEDSPEGYPQTPAYGWWNWHDAYPTTP